MENQKTTKNNKNPKIMPFSTVPISPRARGHRRQNSFQLPIPIIPTSNSFASLSSDEEMEGESEDELGVIESPVLRPLKKRTVDQRSPQKQKQNNSFSTQRSTADQKERWSYLIAQGIQAFKEALLLSADNKSRVATKELLTQAEAVQEGRTICSFATNQELLQEVKVIKQKLLSSPSSTQAPFSSTFDFDFLANSTPSTTTKATPNSIGKKPTYAQAIGLAASTYAKEKEKEKEIAKPKKPSRKQIQEEQKKRQLVIITSQDSPIISINPLEQRNAINKALAQVSNQALVVSSVTTTAKNNLVLTTTQSFSANFLLEHKEKWQPIIQVKHEKLQKIEQWEKIVAHGVYLHKEFILNPLLLKEEIELFNNIQIQGNPRWLVKKEKLENVNLIDPSKRFASIVFEVKGKQEKEAILSKKILSIAGQRAYLASFQAVNARTQCSNCYALGHNNTICKSKGCKFCNLNHLSKDHPSCKECTTLGSLCKHQTPICRNCEENHIATSANCSKKLAIIETLEKEKATKQQDKQNSSPSLI